MATPRTLFEKIWDAHIVRPQTDEAPAVLYIDLQLIHEVTSPQAFTEMRQRGLTVRRPDKTLATMDHSTPTTPRGLDGIIPVTDPQAIEQLNPLEKNSSPTPRPTALLKKFLTDETTVVSRATTFANAANLAPAFMRDIEARYGGTRLGRQELMGELIEDDPNALFKREQIEKQRVKLAPTLKRIVVAVDPPAGFGKKSNACGLVVAGTDGNGNVYVLEDATVRGLRPAGWAKRTAKLFEDWKADRVVAEINQGGAMVEQVLREVNPDVSFKSVHASRGKSARAEPVAALYEQGRVFHVGSFPELEDEMCNEIKTGIHSPDRLDALVWAITELLLTKGPAEPRVRMV